MSRSRSYLSSWSSTLLALPVKATNNHPGSCESMTHPSQPSQGRGLAHFFQLSCRSDMARDRVNPARGACDATGVIPGVGDGPPFVTYQAHCVSKRRPLVIHSLCFYFVTDPLRSYSVDQHKAMVSPSQLEVGMDLRPKCQLQECGVCWWLQPDHAALELVTSALHLDA